MRTETALPPLPPLRAIIDNARKRGQAEPARLPVRPWTREDLLNAELRSRSLCRVPRAPEHTVAHGRWVRTIRAALAGHVRADIRASCSSGASLSSPRSRQASSAAADVAVACLSPW